VLVPPSPTAAAPARPLLKPALRRLWLGPDTLQLGLHPRRAVVLSGLVDADVRLLELLDGSRDLDALASEAAKLGRSGEDVAHFVTALSAAGVLDHAADMAAPRDEWERQRLEPDRLALSLRHPEPGAADRTLARRRDAHVAVHGCGRTGASVATLLAAAGVGHVTCHDPVGLRVADLSPAGVTAMRGGPRGAAAAARVEDTASVSGDRGPVTSEPDLVVVAPTAVTAPPEVLVAVRRRPHLLLAVRETSAYVGPFVLPGRTPCLRCVELARGERNPGWPAVAAQLASSTNVVEAGEVALATTAAGIAAMHALTWLDTGEAPASAGALLEVDASGLARRRSVRPHPACGCGAAD
jgi:bacteriocin biosynthesis cyclodehydratase domain-containing protein